MSTIVVCDECGLTLEPTSRVGLELRVRAFTSAESVDELDVCAVCAEKVRARFVSSPGLERAAADRDAQVERVDLERDRPPAYLDRDGE